MIGYIKCFDSNKTISFKVIDKKTVKKVDQNMGKSQPFNESIFDSEPVYGAKDKYIKTKIKSYGDKMNTNVQGKKVPKENTSHRWLSLIMLDSVIRVNQKHYPQTLLKECKYEMKNNKTENLINDDLNLSLFDNETDSESNNETDNSLMINLLISLRIKTVF